MHRLRWHIRNRLSRHLPNLTVFNYCLSLPGFYRGNHRLPRRVEHDAASINDLLFQRMIRNNWTVFEQSCCDKEYAKYIALAKAPQIKVPTTRSVLVLNNRTTEAEVRAWLEPFLGQRLIVKPTHSCEAILHLDRPIEPAQLTEFVRYSKKNFFHRRRETQYANLERKLIIEDNIAPATGGLSDYKFFCANGRILHGRIDLGRFTGDRHRALFSVPDFRILPVRYGSWEIPESVEKPAHLTEMIEIAEQLSRGFDFVRIDLYDVQDGVYFGEFTFTPGASTSNYSDEKFALDLARRIKLYAAEMPASAPKLRPSRQSA